jgi:dienelactone hydrolase
MAALMAGAMAALALAEQAAPARSPHPAATVLQAVPKEPEPAARYLIYLHGRIVEDQGRQAVSPEFGRYEYDGIVNAFAARGFKVIAEVRSPEAGEAFADKVAAQVRALVGAGVPADHVTVVGFSRGGGLTVAAAAKAAQADVRYALLAGCSADSSWVDRWASTVRGRMLSLYDRSDRFKPSCAPLFAKAKGLAETREIELATGLDHGLFYAPRPEWLDPLTAWAQGKRP